MRCAIFGGLRADVLIFVSVSKIQIDRSTDFFFSNANDGFGTLGSRRMKIIWALSALSTILLCIPRKDHSSFDRSLSIEGALLCVQLVSCVYVQSF